MAKHKGMLYLPGLTSMSVEALEKHTALKIMDMTFRE
jgi:hypothetical protein